MGTKKFFNIIKSIRDTVAKETRQQKGGLSRMIIGILRNCLLGTFK